MTTGEIATYTSTVGGTASTYTYTYDGRGNIKTVSFNGSLQYEYWYDELGQLVHYDDYVAEISYYYRYDKAGNIISYEAEDITGEYILELYEYEYTDGKLTSFDGEIISYDSSGRTVYYRGKNIT